jgi:hypothetical protein
VNVKKDGTYTSTIERQQQQQMSQKDLRKDTKKDDKRVTVPVKRK